MQSTLSRARSTRRGSEQFALNTVRTLLGAAAGLLIFGVGLSAWAEESLLPVAQSTIAGAIFALVVGLRAPRHLAAWVTDLLTRARRGPTHDDMSQVKSPTNTPLSLLLAVLGIAAGATLGLSILWTKVVGQLHAWFTASFVWADAAMLMLHLLLGLVAALPASLVLGTAIVLAHRRHGRESQWESAATGCVVAGVGAAAILASAITATPLLLAIAALLCFLAAIVTATLVTSAEAGASQAESPAVDERQAARNRAGAAGISACVAVAASVWIAGRMTVAGSAYVAAGLVLVGLGGGWVTGAMRCRNARDAFDRAGSLLSLMGCTVALISAALLIMNRSNLHVGMTWIVLVTGSGAFGHLYARFASPVWEHDSTRTSVRARLLSRCLACAAVSIWLIAPLSARWLTPLGAIALVSLALVGVAVLVNLKPGSYGSPIRQRQMISALAALGVVFGLLIVGAMVR